MDVLALPTTWFWLLFLQPPPTYLPDLTFVISPIKKTVTWRRARTCTSPERCARRDHEVIFALRPEARPGVGVHRASLRQPRQGAARGPSGRSLGGHGLGIMERAKLVDDSDGGDDSVAEPPALARAVHRCASRTIGRRARPWRGSQGAPFLPRAAPRPRHRRRGCPEQAPRGPHQRATAATAGEASMAARRRARLRRAHMERHAACDALAAPAHCQAAAASMGMAEVEHFDIVTVPRHIAAPPRAASAAMASATAAPAAPSTTLLAMRRLLRRAAARGHDGHRAWRHHRWQRRWRLGAVFVRSCVAVAASPYRRRASHRARLSHVM